VSRAFNARAGRYLVTTAIEESSSSERPLLLLGEWCRRHDRRDYWSRLDVDLALPYGLTMAEKAQGEMQVRHLAEWLLPKIAHALRVRFKT
jgi:hypothetical protein